MAVNRFGLITVCVAIVAPVEGIRDKLPNPAKTKSMFGSIGSASTLNLSNLKPRSSTRGSGKSTGGVGGLSRRASVTSLSSVWSLKEPPSPSLLLPKKKISSVVLKQLENFPELCNRDILRDVCESLFNERGATCKVGVEHLTKLLQASPSSITRLWNLLGLEGGVTITVSTLCKAVTDAMGELKVAPLRSQVGCAQPSCSDMVDLREVFIASDGSTDDFSGTTFNDKIKKPLKPTHADKAKKSLRMSRSSKKLNSSSLLEAGAASGTASGAASGDGGVPALSDRVFPLDYQPFEGLAVLAAIFDTWPVEMLSADEAAIDSVESVTDVSPELESHLESDESDLGEEEFEESTLAEDVDDDVVDWEMDANGHLLPPVDYDASFVSRIEPPKQRWFFRGPLRNSFRRGNLFRGVNGTELPATSMLETEGVQKKLSIKKGWQRKLRMYSMKSQKIIRTALMFICGNKESLTLQENLEHWFGTGHSESALSSLSLADFVSARLFYTMALLSNVVFRKTPPNIPCDRRMTVYTAAPPVCTEKEFNENVLCSKTATGEYVFYVCDWARSDTGRFATVWQLIAEAERQAFPLTVNIVSFEDPEVANILPTVDPDKALQNPLGYSQFVRKFIPTLDPATAKGSKV